MRRAAIVFVAAMLSSTGAFARDWYVNAARGAGKEGTKEKPAKDLGIIAPSLEAGDRVLISAGSYTGRSESGSDALTLPVELLGGYSDDFSARDPWGAHQTVFTGNRASTNFNTQTRLSITTVKHSTALKPLAHKVVVDGILFDMGPRNTYSTPSEVLIKRKAAPGSMPTPDSPALAISTGPLSQIVVTNCLVTNTASSGGAFSFMPGRAAKVAVKNNASINNTGFGFHLGRSFAGDNPVDFPEYAFENNLAVLIEKYDAFSQTHGGSGVTLDGSTTVVMTGNVMGMNDFHGIDNARNAKKVVLKNNVFFGNVVSDFLDFNTKLKAAAVADEAQSVASAEGNKAAEVKLVVPEQWAHTWLARNVIDRNIAEAKVKVANTGANQVRSILGLPVQGSGLKLDSDVWLPRLQLADALTAATRYADAGPTKPAPSGP
jgi:hypothetical protein